MFLSLVQSISGTVSAVLWSFVMVARWLLQLQACSSIERRGAGYTAEGGKEADLAVAVAFSRKTRFSQRPPKQLPAPVSLLELSYMALPPSSKEGGETGNRIVLIALDCAFLNRREGEECGGMGCRWVVDEGEVVLLSFLRIVLGGAEGTLTLYV